jgi:lysophospholipase L1-like esterase
METNGMKLRIVWFVLALAGVLVATQVSAQETGNVPETKAPAATQTMPAAPAAPAQVAPATAAAAPAHMTREEQLKNDWALLGRYKAADETLGAPAAGERRVVFMGDSITDGWHLEEWFPGKPYVNRGISGQTTPQMVLRFHQDVIDLKPKVVVILGGTNDIAGNTGPMTLGETEENLEAMAEMAAAHGIKVVLCSVMPVFDYPWRPGLTPAPKIDEVNAWMQDYAAEKGYVYVDYHTAMKDERDGLPATLSKDGVHPLPAGYAVMTKLAEAGIEKALAQ